MNELKSKDENVKSEEVVNDTGELQQYVTFLIGPETYGVDVLRVHEIIGMTDITFVPNSMTFMKGVINLRGNVVPVVDMRTKLGMDEKDYDATTVIIIVEVKSLSIGMIVDAVSDVIDISVESIQNTPHFSSKIETDYIKNIGRKGDELIIMLDVDKILTTDEIEKLSTGDQK